MKSLTWRALTALVVLIVVISFFGLFKEGKTTPTLFHLPYILWISLVQTALLVVLTFLGARFFPYEDQRKP